MAARQAPPRSALPGEHGWHEGRSPSRFPVRDGVARHDIDLHGVHIPAGSVINVRYAAANRDERHFHDPERLDLALHGETAYSMAASGGSQVSGPSE